MNFPVNPPSMNTHLKNEQFTSTFKEIRRAHCTHGAWKAYFPRFSDAQCNKYNSGFFQSHNFCLFR